ncbi:hypothetical protein V6N13_144575 [Hibiscus sabdariffa]|uniref:Uncharacterized protein n=1 Tax=Hibiscus sabdariffa TaxID=183260 RepID=A0ABR2FLE6_9ROSI
MEVDAKQALELEIQREHELRGKIQVMHAAHENIRDRVNGCASASASKPEHGNGIYSAVTAARFPCSVL